MTQGALAYMAPEQPSVADLAPGLHRDVSADVYHQRRLGLASNGALGLLARSPAHYKAWVDGEQEERESAALLFGAALHCAVLEPDRFVRAYAVEPSFGDLRFKANREERDRWRNAHAGHAFLSRDDADRIDGIAASIRKHPLASAMLRGGQAEVTVRWDDTETGIPCKARLDWYVPTLSMVVDLKSTLDGSASSFRKSVASFGYHRQEAFYRAGLLAVGAPVDWFVFLAVEKAPPYAVSVFQLDEEAVARGYSVVRRGLATLEKCMREKVWPGYPEGIQTIDLPAWA